MRLIVLSGGWGMIGREGGQGTKYLFQSQQDAKEKVRIIHSTEKK